MKLQPTVKWLGGKRQLLPVIKERIPKAYNKYFEPFLGGGAILFDLQPNAAIINDINPGLMNIYIQIKKDPQTIIDYVSTLDSVDCDEEFYLQQRDLYNAKLLRKEFDVELAALFIWLNKHYANGLYRTDKNLLISEFNNEPGKFKSINKDNITNMSKYLQKVEIMNTDFEEALQSAGMCDFIFMDPPDLSVTTEDFPKEDCIRTAKAFRELDKRGCYCMLTSKDTDLTRELYSTYNIEVFDVKRTVNKNASKRLGREMIIRNY